MNLSGKTGILRMYDINRYQKQILLKETGVNGQEKLASAKVLIVGAGGLGVPVLQYLTAAGTGKITIADGDRIALDNLQRQVLYKEADLNALKATTAENSLKALNSEINISAYPHYLNEQNGAELISQHDLVADCTDNFRSRYLLDDLCKRYGKPLVAASAEGFGGQMSVYHYKNGPGFRDLFPEPPENAGDCGTTGILGAVTGIIGSLQALEIIKVITGAGSVASGKMLVYDGLKQEVSILNFTQRESGKPENEKPKAPGVQNSDDVKRLLREATAQVIDVREIHEFEQEPSAYKNLTLNDIFAAEDAFIKKGPMIFLCRNGLRSRAAMEFINKKGGRAYWIPWEEAVQD